MSNSSKDAHPNWRPNFCNSAALPDIKVVRTNFMINFVCVTAALVFIYFALEREYSAFTLGQTIVNMEQQIESSARADKANLALSNEFRDASLEIIDIEHFFAAPLKAHEFLVDFVQLCPKAATVRSIAFSEAINHGAPGGAKVEYRMNVSGEVSDPLVLGEFKNSIETSGVLNVDDLEPSIDESLQRRNVDTGIFPYRISIVLVAEKKPVEKKPKGGS